VFSLQAMILGILAIFAISSGLIQQPDGPVVINHHGNFKASAMVL